jgi:hypothetical protein
VLVNECFLKDVKRRALDVREGGRGNESKLMKVSVGVRVIMEGDIQYPSITSPISDISLI